MHSGKFTKLILFIALVAGCTVEFFPDPGKDQETLVVEGMITDQDRANRIRLSKSTPVGKSIGTRVVKGAIVTITDGDGIVTILKEFPPGTYSTDSLTFRGQPRSSYSLNIKINDRTYETDFIEMKPVPPISSLYYEKVVMTASRDTNDVEEGCRIYVDSYDPTGQCRYFRWDYTETWEYRIPYNVVNRECYVTERSDEILIRNTSSFSQARISKFPVLLVSNQSDRLKETYSVLVSQYSINEQEYNFWERVRNVSQNVGNLYDVTPMAVKGNIRCSSDPGEEVYGYFSVSAVTQNRLFIHDHFFGLPNFYTYCATDTIRGTLPETGLNTDFWVIEDYGDEVFPFWVISTFKECADCSIRGTKVKPPYWIDF